MDINMQAEFHSVTLLCPVTRSDAPGFAPLSSSITLIPLGTENARQLVKQIDLVQLPGGAGWRQSRMPLRLQQLARKERKPSFVGISSDRAKTSWMNRRKNPLSIARAGLRWLDIRATQRYLNRKSTGVFVVGSGVAHLAYPNRNIHVGIASWINSGSISERNWQARDSVRICCASRLEPMKGVGLGIRAIARLKSAGHRICFDIAGLGPELSQLTELVESVGITGVTKFLGHLGYPDAFLSYLRTVDIVLLTNLNDEQPRLIFDAISQGCIPVCPNSAPYLALELDSRLLYERGQSEDAYATIDRLIKMGDRELQKIQLSLRLLASEFTLESMHKRRADWMRDSMTA